MKRIVFLLKKKPPFCVRTAFILRMLINGVRTSFCSSLEDCGVKSNKDALLATDNVHIYEEALDRSLNSLAIIETPDDCNLFKDARYFLMEPFSAQYSYFDNIYRRFNDIPWEPVSTKRLILRETTEADVDIFYEMYKDSALTMYNESLYENPEEERKYAREYKEKVYEVQGFGIWTIVLKKDRRVIGRAGINVREGFDGYEIGFVVGTDYQRKGYATEAIRGIIRYARKNNLSPVCAMVMPGNVASEKLLVKLGFEVAGSSVSNGISYNLMILK